MNERDEIIGWIIFGIFYVIIGYVGYKISNYSLMGLFFVIACIVIFQYWLRIKSNPKNMKEKIQSKTIIEPSENRNIPSKIPVNTSNNKYLKKILNDSEKGEFIKELLEYTEKEIEVEKAMIEGMKLDYKERKYNKILDFNQIYMGSIHTSNIVEYLGVVSSSMLQVGNETGFISYVSGMITMIKPKNYNSEEIRKFDGLIPKTNKRLNIIIDVLQQYNIDYDFSKSSFLKRLTKEELDESLRWVTQMFLLH